MEVVTRTLHFMPGLWYRFLKCSDTERRERMADIRVAEINSNIIM